METLDKAYLFMKVLYMKANTRKQPIKRQKSSKKKRSARISIILLSTGMLSFILLYLYLGYYYKNHFYKNTVINGVDVSNMTVPDAEAAINAEVATYQLRLEGRNGVSDIIRGDSIELHTEFNGYIDKILNQQNGMAWPTTINKTFEYEIETMLEYNEDLLKAYYDRLNFFKEENIKEPVNAYISEYTENGYEIVPEDPGASIEKDKLYGQIVNAILCLEPSIDLEELDVYKKPEITADYPKLVEVVTEINKLTGAKITYHFGDVTEVLDGMKISEWITLGDDFTFQFDESKIKEYVDYIGKTYNSFGRVRKFKTTYGDVLEIKGGDYGWWLDRASEVAELTQLIKKGEVVSDKKPVYFQTAQQYGEDDIGDTYVEVNLTAQHLFFYKEGELILESDFVSGNVAKNYATPVGTYPVQYKERNATLVGEDYETPVKYWMPFNRNIGFHDASWRKEFGKDIYLTKGSHGCINMPPEKAKLMFENIKRGVAVVVYELPGTENYEVKDKTKSIDKEKAPTTKEKKASPTT